MPHAPLPIPHSGPADRTFRRQTLLVWLGLCLLTLIINGPNIAEVRFPDPDDLLRLQQVRDWIGGQSWFDLHQYRIASPAGAAMHWTRLIDPPIAAVILALRPLLGQDLAELIAVTLIPLLTLGCVTALVARFARRMFGSEVGIFALLVLAVSVPVLHQLRPLRIDHHGWQIVMALIALNGAFAGNSRKGATIAGLALAFWLTISIEGLPLAAAFMGLFALRWLRDAGNSAWLSHGMAALALGSGLFWLLGHHPADLAIPYCDVVSGAHLALLGISAAGCFLATRLRELHLWQQVVVLALAASAGVGAAAWLAPACARGGAFAALDPVVREFWYMRVYEGLPLWYQGTSKAIQTVCLPALALVGLCLTWRRATSGRWIWIEYALLVMAALGVAMLVERAAAVAAAFAAPAAAAQVRRWLDHARTLASPAERGGLMLVSLLALVPAIPVQTIINLFAPQQHALERQVRKNAKCELAGNLARTNVLPPADFLTTLDLGPALIHASHHRIVASGHHRSSAAMRDVIDAFRGTPDQAQAIARRHGIEYVAYCPGLFEPMIYEAEAPGGFMAQLDRGVVPSWLEPIRLKGVTGLKLYRVR